MASRYLLLPAALACHLAACSPPPLPPDVAPQLSRAAPAVYSKGTPAPDVQPDPGNAFVRDGRAESILAYIGTIEGRVGQADEEARTRAHGQADGCLTRVRVELGTVARQARARRAELREASFDDPATEDHLFRELVDCAGRADQLAGQCSPVAAYRLDPEYTQRKKMLEARVGPLSLPRNADGHAVSSDMSAEVLTVEQGGMVTGVLGGAPAVRAVSRGFSSLTRAAGNFFGAGPAKTSAAPPPPPPPAPTPSPAGAPVAVPSASPFAQGAPHDAALLLRSAQITLAVYEVEKKMEAVQALATELGGYLALRGDRELTVRVPRERFDEALRRIEGVGDVLHRSVAAEDVTDQFVDLEMRLKNAHAVRARLEKLLETATVKDAVEIQKELAKTTEDIERLEGKLKLLRDRLAFSTLTVTFERSEPQKLRSQALLPFPWMRTLGLGPLLQVSR